MRRGQVEKKKKEKKTEINSPFFLDYIEYFFIIWSFFERILDCIE